jgi:phenylpropionate dioxygenase-like ring-hydroxylating dioxygenase large terminal subunit
MGETTVHVARRGGLPQRAGVGVPNVPDHGPSTMSAEVYRDGDRFERERTRVLTSHWLLAGRVEQIPEPGDWITYEGHDESIVVTRQPDGSLAAFHNVCAHRGPAIVTELTGCGARRFTCPYHGWVYDTAGRLVGVPEREDFDSAHLDTRAPAVAVDVWAGWIWINMLGPDRAPSLVDSIGAEIVADLGAFRMEDMVLHEVLEFDVPVNYKAVVDGFNEIYHVTELHHVPPAFTKSAREATFHIVGDNYMCFVPKPEFVDELADPDYDHHRFAICHYLVFPNTVFNCNPEHIQVFQPIPLGVDRTRFLCWEIVYRGGHDDPEYQRYFRRTMAQWEGLKHVVGEDIGIYEQMARTKRSTGFTTQILSARECKIAHYHEQMDRKSRI